MQWAVAIVGVPAELGIADVTAALAGAQKIQTQAIAEIYFEEQLVPKGEAPDRANGSYIVRFASEEALKSGKEAVATSQPPWNLFPRYHAEPYDNRGWCN